MYTPSLNILTSNSLSGLLSSHDSESSLLSSGEESNVSILSNLDANSGIDGFAGKDIFGTADLSNLNESFFASAQDTDTAGSVAYNSADTAGSVAFNSADTAGSVACADGAGASCGSGEGGGSFSSFC